MKKKDPLRSLEGVCVTAATELLSAVPEAAVLGRPSSENIRIGKNRVTVVITKVRVRSVQFSRVTRGKLRPFKRYADAYEYLRDA
jgi:hypothetical protein